MAIIYSYPTVTPEKTDLVLGTDVSVPGKPTKNFTVQSIIDLVTTATGDLQFVLNLGNTATGVDINLTNNSFRGGGFVTTAGATVSGTTGTGFTNITSTDFTGTIATPAQPNITSLGTLSALVISGPISGTGLITNSNLTGAQNDNVVSTLAIKTYVDNKVGLFDTLQEVLANGNTTGGSDIVVSAGDDITFTDTSKILMGSTAADNFEIYSDSANSIVIDRSPGALKIQTSLLSVRDEADTTQTISASAAGAVELYHAGDKKIETLTGGAKVTGAFQATTSGTFASLINTGTYSDSSGDVGTAGQILSSTGSGTNWVTEVPLYNWSYEGTNIPSGTAMTVTDGTNITTTWDAANYDLTIATTGVPDGSGAANQVTYWSDADTLTGAAGFTFAGGATGKVAIAGELEVGGVLTDGTFTGSAGTYTGYVSITSTDFVGALTGNASTATALAASGAIALTGDTTSTGGPYTYTSGGAINIATTIADTTVTGKVLTNLPTPTSSAIAASDTILAAMAKLQGQITGIPQGLVYKGTWNASTNTPTLASGTGVTGEFYIVSVAGTTNLDGITDWQVGDWAIFVEVGATDTWQKIDNTSAILGSGTANKIAKWTGSNTLATGLIADDGTTVTIGNSGNLIVEGNTTLGDANTDTTTVKGPAIFEETVRINEGISLGANTYGTAGQVLTSGGGSASVNTWTTPTTGTVTSVALTETGNALTITGSPITGSGTINIAGAGTASQYINGALDLVTFPTLDNYQYWVLSDGVNTTNITSTGTATFTGASGITVAESAGTITITGSAQPGTGTQYTLPVWSTTTSLGDSMVSQNAGGTALTVSGSATFTDDVTIDNSSPELYLTPAATKYSWMIAAQENIDQHFEITPSTTVGGTTFNAPALKIDGSNSAATFAGNVTATQYNVSNTSGYLVREDSGSGYGLFKSSTSNIGIASNGTVALNIDSSQNATFEANIKQGNRIVLQDNGTIQWGSSADYGNLSWDTGYALVYGQVGKGIKFATNGSTLALTLDTSQNATFTGDVEIDGNLTVDGNIIHGSGGGIFNGDQAITVAGGATLAFTLTRATTGTMVFDVWLTSETSTATSVAKKYVVAHSYNSTPVYNKVIDTGPDGSNDFTVVFIDSAVGATGTSCKCVLTATGADQNIGYTVQVGHDSTNALTFAAAS